MLADSSTSAATSQLPMTPRSRSSACATRHSRRGHLLIREVGQQRQHVPWRSDAHHGRRRGRPPRSTRHPTALHGREAVEVRDVVADEHRAPARERRPRRGTPRWRVPWWLQAGLSFEHPVGPRARESLAAEPGSRDRADLAPQHVLELRAPPGNAAPASGPCPRAGRRVRGPPRPRATGGPRPARGRPDRRDECGRSRRGAPDRAVRQRAMRRERKVRRAVRANGRSRARVRRRAASRTRRSRPASEGSTTTASGVGAMSRSVPSTSRNRHHGAELRGAGRSRSSMMGGAVDDRVISVVNAVV